MVNEVLLKSDFKLVFNALNVLNSSQNPLSHSAGTSIE
jgi:hypothetical protein